MKKIKYVFLTIGDLVNFIFLECFIILTKDYLAEEKVENTIVKFIPITYL